MKKEELELVYDAIDGHGDSFWNDPSEGNERGNIDGSWNGYLFEEILDMLKKDGYDLRVVKNRTKPLKRRAWKYLSGWGWIRTRIPEDQQKEYERLLREGKTKEARKLLNRYMKKEDVSEKEWKTEK